MGGSVHGYQQVWAAGTREAYQSSSHHPGWGGDIWGKGSTPRNGEGRGSGIKAGGSGFLLPGNPCSVLSLSLQDPGWACGPPAQMLLLLGPLLRVVITNRSQF